MHFLSRRKFIQSAGLSFSALALSSAATAIDTKKLPIKAIAFDAFPIFDPRPIFKNVTDRFPEKGKQLADLWRTKQFAYQWLRTAGGKYKNFLQTTQDALVYAAAETKTELSADDMADLMSGYKNINAWPDVLPALQQLKAMDLKLCFLTNMTEDMIRQGLQNAGAEKYLDHIISTDKIKTYKPDPRAYQLGIDTLKLKKEEILFVPFAGWDMAGAVWFGYRTFWVNRLSVPAEQLDAKPDGAGTNLDDLVTFVKAGG
jgi:2-haloacid dehalogenase